MGVELEMELEEQLLDVLYDLKYERVKLRNKNDVSQNFHRMLNEHNRANLATPITDSEFSRLIKQIGDKGVFESAQILRNKQIIERDTGEKVYVELFNTREWCRNQFQVAHQIQDEGLHKGRYDVTLFVNGLPLVQIELKRRGVDYKEAFNQIARYKLHNFGGLFGFVQLFVVSNGATTKYFANRDGALDFSQTFYWTDAENNRVNNLYDFTRDFLRPCHVAKLMSRFMILNQSQKQLMVMRPYQTYAVESILDQAVNTRGNGFVWHTTGSGKTLTSFKASQLLADEPSIDTVFFLVDRMDLDSQTLDEFNKFHPGSVDTTDKTSTLVKQIQAGNRLIVTTIQKLNRALSQDRYSGVMNGISKKRVVFMIDECHRTQFGQMHNNVRAHFPNSQYFGFTGTPIFAFNKSQDGRTTADVFGKRLHAYLIKDAIRDGNVLGFSVSYLDTIKQRKGLPEEYVAGIDTNEAYNSPLRIGSVVTHILQHHNHLTRNRIYTAMLATASIASLTQYYDAFTNRTHDLTVAAVFSYTDNEDVDDGVSAEHSKDTMVRIMNDYNRRFGTNFTVDVYPAYQRHVAERVKAAEIDVLIVVQKFLTGFDSKKLNTLYVDRYMDSHNLIQAFSRTNRVDGPAKPFGNVVCYRPLKSRVDAAVCLYSEVELADEILEQSYESYLSLFEDATIKLRRLAPTAASVDLLVAESDQKEFVRTFREVGRMTRKLENFTEFDRKDALRAAGFTLNEMADYQSKYLELYRGRQENPKASILEDIDFAIELFAEDKINVGYVIGLMRLLDFSNPDEVTKDLEKIERALSQATDGELALKADLIRAFIRDVLPGLDSGAEVDAAFGLYQEAQREAELSDFADGHYVTVDQLRAFIAEREFRGVIPITTIRSAFSAPTISEKYKASKEIEQFVERYVAMYMY